MARTKSALPWGMMLLFAVLFLAAWWMEDLVLYVIPWRETGAFKVASYAATQVKLATVGSLLWASLTLAVHELSLGAAYLAGSIADAFEKLPASWRATAPLRALSWFTSSLTATFGLTSAADFGLDLLRAVELVLKGLVAINIAAWLYNIGRRLLHFAAIPVRYITRLYAETPDLTAAALASGLPNYIIQPMANGRPRPRRVEYIQFFDHVKRIGIVLPGGGARAVYQAGALKAIYEFLKDYEALDKVKMIAASSTGAWNAMFWVANMIESDHLDHPNIEHWWKSLSLHRIAELRWLLIPFYSDSLLSTAPWRENFRRIFRGKIDASLASETAPHLYLTRSDIEDGVLRYATNWSGLGQRLWQVGVDKDDRYRFYETIEAGEGASTRVGDALFASLDLAPLFGEGRIGNKHYEDGGVLDPIPIRFGSAVEECDLLFVLPLGASVRPKRRRRSTLARAMRLLRISQGQLEQGVLKTADTLNRMVSRVERLDFGVNTMAPTVGIEGVAAEALSGVRQELAEFNHDYRMLYVFSICPSGELELNTFDFWNSGAISNAFDLMYMQTKRELDSRLFEDVEPEDQHVVLVNGSAPETGKIPKPIYRTPAEL